MISGPDYSAAWRDLAQRRMLMWILFLGYIPGLAALCFAFGDYQDALCTRVALGWILVMGVAIARAGCFRCPRCGQLFCFSSGGGNNLLSSRCTHCGLQIDESQYRAVRRGEM